MAFITRGKHMLKASIKNDIPRKSHSRGLSPMEEAEWWIKVGLDKGGMEIKFISKEVGCGVFAVSPFQKGDFLAQYVGEHISREEGERRSRSLYKKHRHSYLYYFRHQEKEICIDASRVFGRIGRAFNDSASPNSRMKKIEINGSPLPYLALFATRLISPGEEIVYDYGEDNLPWRKEDVVEVESDYDSDPFDLNKQEAHEQEDVQGQQEVHVQQDVQGQQEVHEQQDVQGQQEVHEQQDVQAQQEVHEQQDVQGQEEVHEQQDVQGQEEVHKQQDVQGQQEVHEQQDLRRQQEVHEQQDVQGQEDVQGQQEVWEQQDVLEECNVLEEQAGVLGQSKVLEQSGLEEQPDVEELDFVEDSSNSDVFKVLQSIHIQEQGLEEQDILEEEVHERQDVQGQQEVHKQEDVQGQPEVHKQDVCRQLGALKESSVPEQADVVGRSEEEEQRDVQDLDVVEDSSNSDVVLQAVDSRNSPSSGVFPLLYQTKEQGAQEQGILEQEVQGQQDPHVLKECNIPEKANVLGRSEVEEQLDVQDLGVVEDSSNSDVFEVLQADAIPASVKENTYNRPARPCLYCLIPQKSLTRHLKRKHKGEELVKKALSLKDPKERDAVWTEIRKLAIKKHNVTVLQQPGSDKCLSMNLLRERKQGGDVIVMCSLCSGFYSKKKLKQHNAYCTAQENTDPAMPVSISSFTASPFEVRTHDDSLFKEKVLDCFREDDVGNICRKDKLILLFGKESYGKGKGRKKTMTDMRQIALLLRQFRMASEQEEHTGEDMLNRKDFHHLEEALENLTVGSDGNLKAGLRLSLGYILKHCIKTMKGHYTIADELDKAKEVDLFKSVLEMKWDFLFRRSRCLVEGRREDSLRRPRQLPLEDDVQALRNHNVNEMEKMLKDEYFIWGTQEFNSLRALIVCRLTLFNARRGGEPSKLSVKQWQEAEEDVWVNPQFVEKLDDPLEKALVSTYKIAYQSGKNNRLVPILIPNDTICAIRKLVSLREEVGIAKDNIYVFANTQGSQTHVDGWACVKKVCSQVKLRNPKIICADTFRHRASTLYELQDASVEDRRAFYSHMGHSEKINKNIYQCPQGLREILKVAPYLQQIDQGTSNKSECDKSVKAPKRMRKRKAVISDSDMSEEEQFERESNSPSLDENQERVIPARRKRKAKSSDSDENDTVQGKRTRPSDLLADDEMSIQGKKKAGRRYFVWSEEEARVVREYFKDYINDTEHEGTKGHLPGKAEIKEFFDAHPDVLKENQDWDVVKTKVFNERTKRRRQILKMKKTVGIE